MIPQGSARPAVGNQWKSPRAALPNTHQPAQTLCNDAPNQAKPSKTNGCAASGYRADCPKRAFEFPIIHRSALILLDINLPDMDGYAVLQCLRENEATRAIPVLAISANAMPGDLERGKAAGFAAYITKPLDAARLLRVVDDVIARTPG